VHLSTLLLDSRGSHELNKVIKFVKTRLWSTYRANLRTIHLHYSVHSQVAGVQQQLDTHRCGVYAALNAVHVLQKLFASQPHHNDDSAVQQAAVQGMSEVNDAAVDAARSEFG
jgi:hypothetical protein